MIGLGSKLASATETQRALMFSTGRAQLASYLEGLERGLGGARPTVLAEMVWMSLLWRQSAWGGQAGLGSGGVELELRGIGFGLTFRSCPELWLPPHAGLVTTHDDDEDVLDELTTEPPSGEERPKNAWSARLSPQHTRGHEVQPTDRELYHDFVSWTEELVDEQGQDVDRVRFKAGLVQYQDMWRGIARFVESERVTSTSPVPLQLRPSSYLCDLLWHAHMLHSVEYAADCYRLVGEPVLHDPTAQHMLECCDVDGKHLNALLHKGTELLNQVMEVLGPPALRKPEHHFSMSCHQAHGTRGRGVKRESALGQALQELHGELCEDVEALGRHAGRRADWARLTELMQLSLIHI
eukprot:TRINITY_DN13064_c0_g1_i2.p1 TRINITY_DN13064_c0_g1~~TRINITY_DN13064_c0_g1_i2.p1  ORF type:complete len:353 (-),score=59.52 TRINITY_DN13064_c0_g1_i2:3-1061(-)